MPRAGRRSARRLGPDCSHSSGDARRIHHAPDPVHDADHRGLRRRGGRFRAGGRLSRRRPGGAVPGVLGAAGADRGLPIPRKTLYLQELRMSSRAYHFYALLTCMLPPPLARRYFKHCLGLPSATDARGIRVCMGERVSQCGVLFLAIHDFDLLVAGGSQRAIVRFLNQFFSSLDRACDDAGPEVMKVGAFGEVYVVACGLFPRDSDAGPRDFDEGDAEARRLPRQMATLARLARTAHGLAGQFPVQLRAGLHCGPAVAGIVGDLLPRFQVLGDTVNRAARLEQHCPPGAVLLSGEAAGHLRGEGFGVEESPPLAGRGPRSCLCSSSRIRSPGSRRVRSRRRRARRACTSRWRPRTPRGPAAVRGGASSAAAASSCDVFGEGAADLPPGGAGSLDSSPATGRTPGSLVMSRWSSGNFSRAPSLKDIGFDSDGSSQGSPCSRRAVAKEKTPTEWMSEAAQLGRGLLAFRHPALAEEDEEGGNVALDEEGDFSLPIEFCRMGIMPGAERDGFEAAVRQLEETLLQPAGPGATGPRDEVLRAEAARSVEALGSPLLWAVASV
ncbi:unnamed protein product, partial [Prorocentrum cordatum]